MKTVINPWIIHTGVKYFQIFALPKMVGKKMVVSLASDVEDFGFESDL